MSYFVIIRGPLGSGKTTISKKLSKKIDGTHIHVDRVLDEHQLTSDTEDGYISQKSFLKVNEIIVPGALTAIKKRTPVIFDGNFYWKSQIDDLIKKIDAPHHVFTLKVPLGLCIQRDKERGLSHGKDAAEAVFMKTRTFTYGSEIDGRGTEEETIQDILVFLDGAEKL